MSTISIQKNSITDLAADAIVNAANEYLQAGGGVCGAIFRAAGYQELTAACDKIGHCETGSAVITSGFRSKAKYIIHAVGPVWWGGKQGEPELLYGAYFKALELAAENGCCSIGFPLISAGIFGYPVNLAWHTALQACTDFLDRHEQVSIDIIFAVIDEEILELGRKALSTTGASRYKTTNQSAAKSVSSPAAEPPKRKYKIVTLCGSTRFKDAFMEAQKRLTLEGNIVISVGLFGHSGDDEVWTEGTKEMLDDMHKRKIDLADEIFVINVGGYIGSSTRSEIEYAKAHGKAVKYLEPAE